MPTVEAFIRDIDRGWSGTHSHKLRLNVIGSAALMLQVGYQRGTKDSDVLETADLTSETRERLVALAGKGTPLHARHRLYLDIVINGVYRFCPRSRSGIRCRSSMPLWLTSISSSSSSSMWWSAN